MERAYKCDILYVERNLTCKDRVLSNEYADLIIDYDLLPQLLESAGVDACYHAVDAGYGVIYARRSETPPMSIGYYGYSAIPKLYGLMQTGIRPFDPSCLAAMGNIRVQNPPLALQGNGVIIGFIDTGERVILLSFSKKCLMANQRHFSMVLHLNYIKMRKYT